MKKVIIVAFLLIFCSFAYAGEREELVWKVKYLTEHSQNLQREFAQNQAALKEAVARLEQMNKEAKDAEKDGKKAKKASKKEGFER